MCLDLANSGLGVQSFSRSETKDQKRPGLLARLQAATRREIQYPCKQPRKPFWLLFEHPEDAGCSVVRGDNILYSCQDLYLYVRISFSFRFLPPTAIFIAAESIFHTLCVGRDFLKQRALVILLVFIGCRDLMRASQSVVYA